MSVASSDTSVLNCTAIANTVNGTIAPNISWMKDGTLITNSSNVLIITTISDTVAQNMLTILNFTAADSGVYDCIASVNNVNITSDPIELTSGECCVCVYIPAHSLSHLLILLLPRYQYAGVAHIQLCCRGSTSQYHHCC